MMVKSATVRSFKQAWEGTIDFADQILMPTIFPCSFPQYPLVLIDEAQDLSALNHATLRKLVGKRLIGVGDECQAIYGFRGAHADSMKLLQKEFDMTVLVLSISFRCPKAIVKEAQWRAPHMRWPDWAKDGSVSRLYEWSVDDLPNAPVIICRNNAPIFTMAIRLLKAGRYPEIVGNDIGKMLIKILKKFGNEHMTQQQVYEVIDVWVEDKLKRSRNEGKVQDQADCLRVFASEGKNLGEIIAYAEHLMAAAGPVKMMTGHKSKGLEFPDIFLLDRELIRTEDDQQEKNLLYVIQTRAQERLVYIDTEGFVE